MNFAINKYELSNLVNIKNNGNLLFQVKKNTSSKTSLKKIGNAVKRITGVNGLVTATIFNTGIREDEDKIPNVSGLASTTVLMQKLVELRTKNQMLVV